MPTDGWERSEWEEPGCDGPAAADGARAVFLPRATDVRLPLLTRISSFAARSGGPTDGGPAAGILEGISEGVLDGAAVGAVVGAAVEAAAGAAVGAAFGAADISADRADAISAAIAIGDSESAADPDAADPDSLFVAGRGFLFLLRAMPYSRPPTSGRRRGRPRAWPGKVQSGGEQWETRGEANVGGVDAGAEQRES